MSKRKYRKFVIKGYHKKWRNARYEQLITDVKINAIVFHDMSPMSIGLIEVVDSKRGNYKHPQKVIVNHRYFKLA